uniref:Proteinase inhibitor PSI-1.2 n=1 Tax=Nicotiana tabacum TaxID=4097 RepID=A0A1S4DR24_TOBAC|nr:PREDICTED: proteinase inhibitor PSI-1.2-like [Nicotiana tabacum]
MGLLLYQDNFMAIHRVAFLAILLLSGAILLGNKVKCADGKACTRNCDPDVAYMVCPSTRQKITKPCVNCCSAKKGCKLFRSNGSVKCTGT